MKRYLLIIVLLSTVLVTNAKTVDKTISIGCSGEVISDKFGKPNVETEDSDGNLTWIYNEQIPENVFFQERSKISNSVFVVKFDDENKVKSYSYRLNLDMEK